MRFKLETTITPESNPERFEYVAPIVQQYNEMAIAEGVCNDEELFDTFLDEVVGNDYFLCDMQIVDAKATAS